MYVFILFIDLEPVLPFQTTTDTPLLLRSQTGCVPKGRIPYYGQRRVGLQLAVNLRVIYTTTLPPTPTDCCLSLRSQRTLTLTTLPY